MRAKFLKYCLLTTLLAGLSVSTHAQTAADLLEEGRKAFQQYDFAAAARHYASAKKKAKRTDTEFSEKYDRYHHQLTEAENFLERVEKIAIIDSITVSKKDFFKSYRLPLSAGSLSGAEGLPSARADVDYVFTSESGEYKIWAEPDTTGFLHLVEASRLTDGTWSSPSPLDDDLSEDGDENYPFMMSDGVTLYYADNGENSIGGYDIMIATRDASDGTFLQPQNMGFPYNSPFDDYLLAIDELNGVGWWATDRNQLGDDITIYVFVTNELRKNYSDDDEGDIISYARIDDYIATQPEDSDYSELLATIKKIDPDSEKRVADFHFPMPGGKVYTSYNDLKSPQAKNMMKRYLDAMEAYENNVKSLASMRKNFNTTHSSSMASKIISAEKALEQDTEKLIKMRSDLYRLLGNK